MTAKKWSFFTLYIAPIVLHGLFPHPQYYKHFTDLLPILHLLIALELSEHGVLEVERGLCKWVKEYERLYYHYDPQRLSACPATLHALLHLGDDIRTARPLWAYWAYPMERFCGHLQRAIHNRRFPWAEMANYLKHSAQLRIISLTYGLGNHLNFTKRRQEMDRLDEAHKAGVFIDYPGRQLLSP